MRLPHQTLPNGTYVTGGFVRRFLFRASPDSLRPLPKVPEETAWRGADGPPWDTFGRRPGRAARIAPAGMRRRGGPGGWPTQTRPSIPSKNLKWDAVGSRISGP